jgi:hypothetical protein
VLGCGTSVVHRVRHEIKAEAGEDQAASTVAVECCSPGREGTPIIAADDFRRPSLPGTIMEEPPPELGGTLRHHVLLPGGALPIRTPRSLRLWG